MTTDDDLPVPLHDRRLIRETLSPLAERVGVLQNEATSRYAIRNSIRGKGAAGSTDLLNQLNAIQWDLAKAIAALPERLREDGRVLDLAKSLRRLREMIDSLDVS